MSGTTDTLEREEHLTIPYKAIREGVVNALTHRSYRDTGGSVGIAIYDDRIEITNSGVFPQDMSMERLLGLHDSQPHNPIIANVLYKSTVLESWGRGIKLMVDECRRVGIQDPEFHCDGGFVRVVFHYTRYVAGQVPDKYPTVAPQLPDSYPTATPQVGKVLSAIGERTLSAKEIMGIIGLKDKSNFLELYLYPATKQNLVEPLYPDQPKHPKQKYRLTEQGRALLQDGGQKN